jgi:hypothetical protein
MISGPMNQPTAGNTTSPVYRIPFSIALVGSGTWGRDEATVSAAYSTPPHASPIKAPIKFGDIRQTPRS